MDGFTLAGREYLPARNSSPYVLIAPAVAVKQRFYDKYARFLCERGFGVVTFDYRGIGDSRPRRLAGFDARMQDWGAQDLAGVIDWVAARAGGRVLAVGHSAGGQLLGLAANNHKIRGLLAIAAQSGYWGLWPFPRKYWMAALWYVLMPGLTRVFRYFPGKHLGLAEDLPAGVALEWARWSRSPAYIAQREYFDRFPGAIRYYSFADDSYAPRRAVESLIGCYSHARKEGFHVSPRALGAARIGHFGFFREPLLWSETADWLARQ